MKGRKAGSAAAKARSRMRILFVSEYFYPKAAGGEVWSWELCESLAAQGHEITVITSRYDDSLKAKEDIKGVRILRPVRSTPDSEARLRRAYAARRLARAVSKYLHAHRTGIDIVHVMAYGINVPVSRVARKLGIPCVTSVHSYFGREWRKLSLFGHLLEQLERRALRNDVSTAMHVPSRYLQQRIKEECGKETIVVHNWLPARLPKAKPLPHRTFVFVGSLESVKDPLACIPVAKRLGARLVVIGKGTLEKEMRTSAGQQDVECEFLGSLTHEQTLQYIGGASLVLVPSVTESFSLVALEAIAQGTPVAGTQVGVLPELPGVVPFPPKRIPARIPPSKSLYVARSFAKERLVGEFLSIYRSATKR